MRFDNIHSVLVCLSMFSIDWVGISYIASLRRGSSFWYLGDRAYRLVEISLKCDLQRSFK